MRKMRINLRQDYAKILPMKLPTPRKRGDAYRIEIMIDGQRMSATRDTIKECHAWASRKLLESKAGQLSTADTRSQIKLDELMTIQYESSRRQSKGKRTDLDYQRMITRDYAWLTSMRVVDITAQDLTRYRDMRLQKVASSTVLRDFSYLSSVFSYAVKNLFIIDKNPCLDVHKPSKNKDRYRRITQDEIDALLIACDYQVGQTPTLGKHYVGWCLIWAIESAMRRGEIFGMTWGDVHKNHVHLPVTKTDDPRDVPLSPVMRELLACLSSFDRHDKKDNLFVVNVESFKTAFDRACVKAGIKDLQFRDTRHEAISRFVKTQKLPVELVAKITGHKKIETLLNVYYNPTADELYDAMYGDK